MNRRFITHRRPQEGGEEAVWISFSDFMTALFTVFMLAAVALVFSLTQEQEALADATAQAEAAQARGAQFTEVLDSLGDGERTRATMVRNIQKRLAQQGIHVEVDKTSSVLRIPVDLLGFDSGSADISPQHRANALAIGRAVATVLRKNDQYKSLDTVFIEGHTDDRPISGVYGGNWGLSANRAIALWRLWEDNIPGRLGDLEGHTGERLFSASGYGDTRPVTQTQNTEAQRAQNRRIDIRFTEHRLSEEEIQAVQDATTLDSADQDAADPEAQR